MATQPLNVLWLIDHVCYDGSLHAGGRLYMNVFPRVDDSRVRIHPYFLRATEGVSNHFRESNHPVINLGLGKYNVLSPLKVAQLVRKHKIDVMHLFCFGSSTFGRMASLWHRVPTVIHEFDTPTYGPYPATYKALDKMLVGRTNFALGASTHCVDFIHTQRSIPRDKIEVLYHAVPSDKYEIARTLTREAARQQLGWDDGRFVFLAVTKLGPDRGNKTLLAAFEVVRKQIPNARLCMVYQPTLYHRMPVRYKDTPWLIDPETTRTRILQLIDQHGLHDSVSLVEMKSPVKHEPYYAASDVLVAPFQGNLFSSVNLIEAMVFGLPHIVTDIGEPADIVDRWGAGVKVPQKNPAELAKAMIEFARNDALRKSLSQKARTVAVEFGVQSVADRLTRLYTRLAKADQMHSERVGATG